LIVGYDVYQDKITITTPQPAKQIPIQNTPAPKKKNGYLVALLIIAGSLVFLLFLGSILNKCSSKNEVVLNETKSNNTIDRLKNFEVTVSRLKGSSFVERSELKSDTAFVIYYDSYSQFKKYKPENKLKNSDFNTYWDSEKTVKKTIISGVGNILEKNNFINVVDIKKKYKGVDYHVVSSRNEIEKLEYNMMTKMNMNVDEKFSDNFVYNDKGRELFYILFKK